jgi:hypothetical protein
MQIVTFDTATPISQLEFKMTGRIFAKTNFEDFADIYILNPNLNAEMAHVSYKASHVWKKCSLCPLTKSFAFMGNYANEFSNFKWLAIPIIE